MPNNSAVMKQVLIIWMFFPLVLTSVSVQAADSIKINAYIGHPPYLYNEGGQQAGLYMRIVDLTFKAIGQPYSVNTLSFKRGLYQTTAGNGVMVGLLKTDQRMQTLDFSEPFYQERVSVYLDQQRTPLIKTVNELDGLTIGILLGWSYGAEFDQAKENNRFYTSDSNLETNLNLLAKGRLDAVIHPELSVIYVLNKLGLRDKVFLASEPLALGNIHIAARKGTHKELLEKFNKKLSEPEHIKAINLLIRNYKE